MAVRSEPLVKQEESSKRRTSPAVVSRGGVIGAMIATLRIMAVLLMAISTFGNYVQFMGGWEQYLPFSIPVIGLAFAYQMICSLLQWGFKAGRMWFPYVLALLASAIPSFLTYNALFGPYLVVQVGAVLAPIGIGIAVIGGDALPEWVLVE